MSAVGITENVKGDVKKFEIWQSGREVVYIVQVTPCLLAISVGFSFWAFTHWPLCFCLGSYGGGESCLADGDSKNSHQPREARPR